MKKILISLMVLAVVATPLTLARPHYSSTGVAGTATSDSTVKNKDAKNYQNLKGNYKAPSTNPTGTTAGVADKTISPSANNLKSNFNRGTDATTAGVATGSAPARKR